MGFCFCLLSFGKNKGVSSLVIVWLFLEYVIISRGPRPNIIFCFSVLLG